MNILDTALQSRYTVGELNEAIRVAVLAEQQACAATVCPWCKDKMPLSFADGIFLHWLSKNHHQTCRAAPIHARGRAQAEQA